jgi:predicted small secreted protein
MRTAVILLAGLLVLSACNTVEGVGRDVQGAGEVLEEGARKTKNAIVN